MYIPGSQLPSNAPKFFQLLHVCMSLRETGSPSTAVVSVRDASCPFCGLVCLCRDYLCPSCVLLLFVKGLGNNFLRVTLCLVMWFPGGYCLCVVFGGQAVAESPAPGAHGCLFLTVSKISIGNGTCGFGERELEGLPDIYEGMWLQELSEELLHFCGGDLRRCVIDNLPRAVTCVCLCVDERFSPPPVTFLCVNFF